MRRSERHGFANERATLADYHLRWVACVELKQHGSFYTVADEDLESVPDSGTGIYMFCRRHGGNLSPQYVGCSKRLRQRIREHLERVSLVRALASGEAGRRIVLVAVVQPRRGQRPTRVAREVEDLLIRRFRDEAYELVNEKCTRRRARRVCWYGSNAYLRLIPRRMKL